MSTEAHACALICVDASQEALGVNAVGALSQNYPELQYARFSRGTRALQWLTAKFCLSVFNCV